VSIRPIPALILFLFALYASHWYTDPVRVLEREYEELTHTPSLEQALGIRARILEQVTLFETARRLTWDDLPFKPQDVHAAVHNAAERAVTQTLQHGMYETDRCDTASTKLADATTLVREYHLSGVDLSTAHSYVTETCMRAGMAAYRH
jgi:hypothetical protein